MTVTRTYPAPGTVEGLSQADTFTDLSNRLAVEINALGQADEYDVPMTLTDSDLETLKAAHGVLVRLADGLRTA